MLPVTESSRHRDEGVRRPCADEQEENSEGHFGNANLHAPPGVFLVCCQGLYVHLLSLLLKHAFVETYLKVFLKLIIIVLALSHLCTVDISKYFENYVPTQKIRVLPD